ncbi:hypothetical protein [Saccharopolyspora sp. NPDC002376]
MAHHGGLHRRSAGRRGDRRGAAHPLSTGALNYLVKPFTAELADRLNAYARYHARLSPTGGHVGQDEIDRAMRVLHEGDQPGAPKGQSAVTSRLVQDALRAAGGPR